MTKLYEIVIFLVIFTLFLSNLNGIEKLYSNLPVKTKDLKNKAISTNFIYESFKSTCEGKSFSSLNEWQEKCGALWNLEYIAWSNAEDFMDVSYKNCDNALFYGVWISKYGKYEVYCRNKTNSGEKLCQ